MIFGVGVDIVKVCRMEAWIKDKAMLARFFNTAEAAGTHSNIKYLCEHYAARFAAKEAFSKALGTGLAGFALRDVYVEKDADGKPHLVTVGTAKEVLERVCKNAVVHVSLSHEKEYALSFVVIEKDDKL